MKKAKTLKKPTLTRIIRSVLTCLPTFIRYPLMRTQLKIDSQLPEGLDIRVARTKEELTAAYRILHDSYVEMGYMTPQANGMRVIKYFALPTTTNLIAVLNGKVIGTISVIRRTSMGLPLESICSIESHCGQGSVAEISSLAIAKDFRMGNGAVFLPLLKYLLEYTRHYMGINRFFLAVNPRQVDFYQGLLLFDRLPMKTVKEYSFANNHAAVVLTGDFDVLEKRGKKVYGNKPAKTNLYHYFYKSSSAFLQFPDRTFKKIMDPVLSPDLFSYFFCEQSNVLNDLSVQDKRLLSKVYPPQFQSLIWSATPLRIPGQRFPVDLKSSDQISVLDVSRRGLKVKSAQPIRDGETLEVEIAAGTKIQLQVKVIWSNPELQETGMQILACDSKWNDYLAYLEQDFGSDGTAPTSNSNRKIA